MTDLERAQAMDKWTVNSWRGLRLESAENLAQTLRGKGLDRIMLWPMGTSWTIFARQPLQGRVN